MTKLYAIEGTKFYDSLGACTAGPFTIREFEVLGIFTIDPLALVKLRTAPPAVVTTLMQARNRLQQMQPLVTRILNQTRARLLGGDTTSTERV